MKQFTFPEEEDLWSTHRSAFIKSRCRAAAPADAHGWIHEEACPKSSDTLTMICDSFYRGAVMRDACEMRVNVTAQFENSNEEWD